MMSNYQFMDYKPITLLMFGYAFIALIIVAPLYFYWNKKFLEIKLDDTLKKYSTYALFLILTEFAIISFGLVKSEQIKISEYDLYVFAITNSLILAPILEEIFFRSHIVVLIEKFTSTSSWKEFCLVIASNIIWSAGHIGESVYFYIHTFVFGMVLSFLRLRTGSLIACVILHMLANVLGTVALFI